MSTCVEFDGVSQADFDQGVHDFLRSFRLSKSYRQLNRRPLTLNTFDCAIRLYAVMKKEITSYHFFTLARAQGRVHPLSDPSAFRSDQPAPSDKETQRVWRAFLLYELFCMMHGIPQVTAHAARKRQMHYREVEDLTRSFEGMSPHVREGFLCVQQYVLEQYNLVFNSVVERFGLAVEQMGRCAAGGSQSIIELDYGDFPSPVEYLYRDTSCPYEPNFWEMSVSMLGVSFLQEFLSWDSTTRLDFIRTTFYFLSGGAKYSFYYHCGPQNNMGGLSHKEIVLPRDPYSGDEDYLRLRAVGWIFWDDPDRLSSMNLVRGPADRTYKSENGILPYLKLNNRPFLVERSTEPQDWERIVKDFGVDEEDYYEYEVRSLIMSLGTLKSDRIAEMISAQRLQDVEGTPPEAEDNND